MYVSSATTGLMLSWPRIYGVTSSTNLPERLRFLNQFFSSYQAREATQWMTLRDTGLPPPLCPSQRDSHPDCCPASPALPAAHPGAKHTHTHANWLISPYVWPRSPNTLQVCLLGILAVILYPPKLASWPTRNYEQLCDIDIHHDVSNYYRSESRTNTERLFSANKQKWH